MCNIFIIGLCVIYSYIYIVYFIRKFWYKISRLKKSNYYIITVTKYLTNMQNLIIQALKATGNAGTGHIWNN